MKKINILLAAAFATASMGLVSCSDSYMENLNKDKTKASELDPNSQLTTALLQTYGDFQLMDTYRCYITGFTQHFAGGWNVSNYGGAVNAANDMMRQLWDEYYNVGIKNLVDAIKKTEDRPNLNAVLRIHRVYMLSILTDTYGDIPCKQVGLGYLEGINNPKYDKQEDIYNWFFEELDACIKQLGSGTDHITGDVTAYKGDIEKWRKYANSLRMRYAMRISDIAPEKAKTQFETAVKAECGYLSSVDDNAYVRYIDAPFTLYDGARDLDFRANALGETLYGQDATSPSFVCATLYEMMKKNDDPRLYRICAHYCNVKRAEDKADEAGSLDLTNEVRDFLASPAGQALESDGKYSIACVPGAAWYSEAVANEGTTGILSKWIQIEDGDIEKFVPTLWKNIQDYPDAGYNRDNYQNRMLRPALSVKLEKSECPGILMTNAEVEFLLAEAKSKGWTVAGDVTTHYEKGVRAAMEMLNACYGINKISDAEIANYIAAHPVGTTAEEQKERINTEAWILHTMNPSEAWANMRRSDYPYTIDRNRYYIKDFVSDDTNMTTPVRLKYPTAEFTSNNEAYTEALSRMGGKDDWHHRVWWDAAENTHLQ